VLQQDDGDMLVAIVEDPEGDHGGIMVGVEFCTSGGKSPKTLALNAEMKRLWNTQ